MATKQRQQGLRAEHTLEVRASGRTARLTLNQFGRRFKVIGTKVLDNDELELAFKPSGNGVINLDDKSDIAQCFGHSSRVRVDGITLSFSEEMVANSFEELAQAFSKVRITTFLREEI